MIGLTEKPVLCILIKPYALEIENFSNTEGNFLPFPVKSILLSFLVDSLVFLSKLGNGFVFISL